MVAGDLKQKIDGLWQEFWQGGIANPLTVIEQITFLMFLRILDINEIRNENLERKIGKKFRRQFNEEEQLLRWSNFKHLGGSEMLPLLRDSVFPHFRKIGSEGSSFALFMKDAQLLIQKETLLVTAVNAIDQFPLKGDDTKGDLYEYLLMKMTTAGINGQFRTPRHIIDLMVKILDPKPFETIADPAVGTGGFMVQAILYLLKKHTSPEIFEDTGLYVGDKLEDHWEHIKTKMFTGYDFDSSMLRIASMNLMLHGIDDPSVNYQDTLSSNFSDKYPDKANNYFDVILANPPFKGSLDFEDVNPELLRTVKTKKTELLFLALILKMLKPGGRSAVIVPDGVLFGSSQAHVQIRKLLLEENQLEAVISLPSGVFKPYAGVSTGILIFKKGGQSDNVFFYDIENDGYTLDDKREPTPDKNDLPDCYDSLKNANTSTQTDRTKNSFFISAEEIRKTNYDLSINRYKKREYKEEEFDPPTKLLENLKRLNVEIQRDLIDLESMLK